MSFLIPLLLAFLTKPFLNTPLCRGQYGFMRTYFGFGLFGMIILSVAVFGFLGPIFFSQDQGKGERAISITFRVWSLVTTFYVAGIGLALQRIRATIRSIVLQIYVIILMASVVVLALLSIKVAIVYWLIYAIATFILYRTCWNHRILEVQA
jgi:hypothetical protein